MIDTQHVQTELGGDLDLQYYITVDDLMVGESLLCESYGAMICNLSSGVSESVRNITTSAAHIEHIVGILHTHSVTPETLFDVIIDMI